MDTTYIHRLPTHHNSLPTEKQSILTTCPQISSGNGRNLRNKLNKTYDRMISSEDYYNLLTKHPQN